jgi:hypothetical protein
MWQQRDTAMAKVVRREGGNAGRGAGTRQRRPQPIAGDMLEDAPVRVAGGGGGGGASITSA